MAHTHTDRLTTHDISLAAFLLAHDYELTGTRQDGRRTYWTFQTDGEDIQALWLSSAECRFSQSLRSLKLSLPWEA